MIHAGRGRANSSCANPKRRAHKTLLHEPSRIYWNSIANGKNECADTNRLPTISGAHWAEIFKALTRHELLCNHSSSAEHCQATIVEFLVLHLFQLFWISGL